MIRGLLAFIICCSTANGFPAPKPTQAPTTEELIIGTWELVTWHGQPPKQFALYEFTANHEFTINGKVIITTAGERVGKGLYGFTETPSEVVVVILSEDRGGETGCYQIRSITAREMVFVDLQGRKSVFKRQ